jgi:S1-C subfamily serine protease
MLVIQHCRLIGQKIIGAGNVQRAILGVEGGELNATTSKALKLTNRRFYVSAVTKFRCWKSGLKREYYIKMDGQKIATYADLSGYINKRPNDKIQVTIPEMEKTTSSL